MTRISVREAMRSELEAKKEVDVAREEMLEMKKELAWYSLHVAAAAACRGSTPSGGTGPWANSVLAKENTRSCDDQCADTTRTVCDADIAIQGKLGKARIMRDEWYNLCFTWKSGRADYYINGVSVYAGDVHPTGQLALR